MASEVGNENKLQGVLQSFLYVLAVDHMDMVDIEEIIRCSQPDDIYAETEVEDWAKDAAEKLINKGK